VAAEGGRVGVSFNQRSVNGFQDSRKIPIDIAIPETKNQKAGAAETIVAPHVIGSMGLKIMLASVDFDDETILQADKIDDVAVPRGLPAKMKSLFAPSAKVIPDLHFLRRQRFS
jgi:hypothetical protein